MNVEAVGFVIDTIGKLLVGYTSLMVHHRFSKERQVDEAVFSTMRTEQVVGVLGMIMILVGSSLELSVIW